MIDGRIGCEVVVIDAADHRRRGDGWRHVDLAQQVIDIVVTVEAAAEAVVDLPMFLLLFLLVRRAGGSRT